MTSTWIRGCNDVLRDVFEERCQQEARYGDVNDLHENGTGPDLQWLKPWTTDDAVTIEKKLREDYDSTGRIPTWAELVREELAEALLEDDVDLLASELIQVAALCVSWVERLRARRAESALLP